MTEQEREDKFFAEVREELKKFIGKPLDEVRAEVEQAGWWAFRITQVDGKPRIITHDLKMNRVNVRVENGNVTEAYLG